MVNGWLYALICVQLEDRRVLDLFCWIYFCMPSIQHWSERQMRLLWDAWWKHEWLMSKGTHSLGVPIGTKSSDNIPHISVLLHAAQSRAQSSWSSELYPRNEWSSLQAGPISNSRLFLLPSLSPPCPYLDCTFCSPDCSPPSLSLSQRPPRFTTPTSGYKMHSWALWFRAFQAAHCFRFRHNLPRSMRMQPLWGQRPGLINRGNSLQRLAPVLGT